VVNIINLTTGISLKWLEASEGEMFDSEIEHEIEGIVNLYRQLKALTFRTAPSADSLG